MEAGNVALFERIAGQVVDFQRRPRLGPIGLPVGDPQSLLLAGLLPVEVVVLGLIAAPRQSRQDRQTIGRCHSVGARDFTEGRVPIPEGTDVIGSLEFTGPDG